MLFTKEKIQELEWVELNTDLYNLNAIYTFDGYHVNAEFRAWARKDNNDESTGYKGGYYIEDVEIIDVTITNDDEVKLAGKESVDIKYLEQVIAADLDNRDYAQELY